MLQCTRGTSIDVGVGVRRVAVFISRCVFKGALKQHSNPPSEVTRATFITGPHNHKKPPPCTNERRRRRHSAAGAAAAVPLPLYFPRAVNLGK